MRKQFINIVIPFAVILALIVLLLFLSSTREGFFQDDCEKAKTDYLAKNPDVAKAKMDPWWHYNNFGKKEGRKWSAELCKPPAPPPAPAPAPAKASPSPQQQQAQQQQAIQSIIQNAQQQGKVMALQQTQQIMSLVASMR